MSTTTRRPMSATIDPRDPAAEMLMPRLQLVEVATPTLEETYRREREAKLEATYRRNLLRMLQTEQAPADIYVRTVH